MNNYSIINDLTEFRTFIDWLPELQDNEIFYGCLFARKKYSPEMICSSDKTQLKRFTFKKSNFEDKVRQLECPVGSYKLKDRECPQESLVLYVNPNPRDQRKATFASIIELTRLIERNAINFNLHQEVMSNIQRLKGSTHFVDFDFDLVDKESEIPILIERIKLIINQEALTFIETRGGIHCLVKPIKIYPPNLKSSWYNEMMKIAPENLDQKGDQLLPVPGSTQGGFIPKFIK